MFNIIINLFLWTVGVYFIRLGWVIFQENADSTQPSAGLGMARGMVIIIFGLGLFSWGSISLGNILADKLVSPAGPHFWIPAATIVSMAILGIFVDMMMRAFAGQDKIGWPSRSK